MAETVIASYKTFSLAFCIDSRRCNLILLIGPALGLGHFPVYRLVIHT